MSMMKNTYRILAYIVHTMISLAIIDLGLSVATSFVLDGKIAVDGLFFAKAYGLLSSELWIRALVTGVITFAILKTSFDIFKHYIYVELAVEKIEAIAIEKTS